MTEPKALSQEQRVELVAKAKAATDGRYMLPTSGSTILSYEATVVALTVERDAALERVKALKAGAKPFIDAALQIPAEVEDFKVIAHVPGGPNAKAYLRVSELLTAGAFRQARAALHPEPLGEGGGL